ncbi:unnamed protein product [Camellia sinensis]
MRKWTSKDFADFVSCETIKGEVPAGLNFAAGMGAPVFFFIPQVCNNGRRNQYPFNRAASK